MIRAARTQAGGGWAVMGGKLEFDRRFIGVILQWQRGTESVLHYRCKNTFDVQHNSHSREQVYLHV